MPFAGIFLIIVIGISAIPILTAVYAIKHRSKGRRWFSFVGQVYLLIVSGLWAFFLVVPSGALPLDILLTVVLPPIAVASIYLDALKFGLYAIVVTSLIFAVFSMVVMSKMKGIWAFVAPIFLGPLVFITSFWIQGLVSDGAVVAKAGLLDATCVEFEGFRTNLTKMSYIDGRPFSTSFHGVATAGDAWYIWSYREQNWVQIDPNDANVPMICNQQNAQK